MVNKETASVRYTKTLELFKKSRIEGRGESLSYICKTLSVSYKGLLSWMKGKGITVRSIKKDLPIEIPLRLQQVKRNDDFIPITVSPESRTTVVIPDYLSDINLTFSDGTMISIPNISADAVISLIGKYIKMTQLC